MELLELSLESPFENVALDEALLERAEKQSPPIEVLRLWEAPTPMVVLGRSSQVEREIDRAACKAREVAIARRSSGGSSVVAGPGCLMYSLVLSCQDRPHLRHIDQAHQFVLAKIVAALSGVGLNVEHVGVSDLAIGDDRPRKVSGNSLRYRRQSLLYHGTLLYDFPLELISACLRMPPRQPDYRDRRNHNQFVSNLPMDVDAVKRAIANQWHPATTANDWPIELTRQMVAEKHGQPGWIFVR